MDPHPIPPQHKLMLLGILFPTTSLNFILGSQIRRLAQRNSNVCSHTQKCKSRNKMFLNFLPLQRIKQSLHYYAAICGRLKVACKSWRGEVGGVVKEPACIVCRLSKGFAVAHSHVLNWMRPYRCPCSLNVFSRPFTSPLQAVRLWPLTSQTPGSMGNGRLVNKVQGH